MKLYFEAEQYVVLKDSGPGSLQSRIFGNTRLTNSPKHIYAMVYSTLKYREYIETIIKKSKIRDSIRKGKTKVSDGVLLLMVNDLLFLSQGRIQLKKHPIKDAFLQNKTRLQAEFIKLKIRYKVKSAAELPTKVGEDETPVRWFRINGIKIGEEEFFKKHLYFSQLTLVELDKIEVGCIYRDEFVPGVFGVHPREKITSSKAFEEGEIIIQDRASCFPAFILNEDTNHQHRQVIDACAAPGNKTTHLASILAGKDDAIVYAFEKDNYRVQTLKKMSKRATGVERQDLIQVTHADFTSVNPGDFANVTGLVVDPSCSGSGIFGRALEDSQEELDEEVDTARLQKLANFQFKIMKHALLFPKARKVVYSTCSIHAQENERVVVDLLLDQEVRAWGWKLAPREHVVPQWPRRGWKQEFTSLCNSDEECIKAAEGCIRFVPKEDKGIGFFAAAFTRDDVK